MDSQLATSARILSTTDSVLIFTEVCRDLLLKWPPPPRPSPEDSQKPANSEASLSLDLAVNFMRLFQYIGVAQIRAGRYKLLLNDSALRSTFLGKFKAIPGDIWSLTFLSNNVALPEIQHNNLNTILDLCESYIYDQPYSLDPISTSPS